MSNEKTVAKGSPAPGPVPKGTIRLYSMRFCPYAQRTRLVLQAKEIKHDTININLRDKPEWFFEKNPLGLVPALETPAGEVIYESLITSDYLDEVYPGKKLLPSSPYGKAQQKMMLEHFSKKIPHLYKILAAKKNGKDVSELEAEVKKYFDKCNEHLVTKKTKFFGGDSITMIDYMMWPFFERLEVISLQSYLDNTPELKKWKERMLEDPAVKDTMFSVDDHKKYYKTYLEGKSNYDYGFCYLNDTIKPEVAQTAPHIHKILVGKKNGKDVSEPEAEVKKYFVKLNENLVKKKTKFFGGDSVTMIDYMIWPFFERLEAFGLQSCLDITPELNKWTERMLEDPAVKATMFSVDDHKNYYKTYFEGKPNYSDGL